VSFAKTVKIGEECTALRTKIQIVSSRLTANRVPNKLPRMQTLPTRKQLQELIKSDPDDLFLHYALAKACVAEGDFESGLAQFRSVIERDPNYVPAYFQMAQALAERGRLEEARDAVSRGIGVAHQVGDRHAESEMTGFLESLPAS
jgi:tetratricopeptide (TPR) repeat protein